jgi:hypothetical protein
VAERDAAGGPADLPAKPLVIDGGRGHAVEDEGYDDEAEEQGG